VAFEKTKFNRYYSSKPNVHTEAASPTCFVVTSDTFPLSWSVIKSLHKNKMLRHGRCICEIKSKIAMEKAAFNKKKTPFTSKLNLNMRKKLEKCYI
jgi:hypothetical protein